jgi:serine/threonine-protein kinase PpkA
MDSKVTVLYAAAVGAERQAHLEAFHRVVGSAIARQRGKVLPSPAGSAAAFFSSLADAKADHATRALHAAVVAVHDIMKLANGATAPVLQVSVGVHMGRADPESAKWSKSEPLLSAQLIQRRGRELGWSIATSQIAGRAAGPRIALGAAALVALPGDSYIDLNQVVGLSRLSTSRTPPETYQALVDAVSLNGSLLRAADGDAGNAPATRPKASFVVSRRAR